jgi:hydrogenase expression/formation protein HypD
LALNAEYRDWDAEHRFPVADLKTRESVFCRSGDVLQGLIKPTDCPEFGVRCTPEKPLGATMVSSEGACAAYFHYRGRHDV